MHNNKYNFHFLGTTSMKIFKVVFGFTLCLMLASCNGNRLDVDISSIEMEDIEIKRLDQDVFNLDTLNLEANTNVLIGKYGNFYKIFVRSILNNGGMRDSSYAYRMKRFITDKDMSEAYDLCQATYPNLNEFNEELTRVFKRYKYHFPNSEPPQVVAMMSGFNRSSVFVDSTLAIGLEMYLGKDCKFYRMLGLKNYKIIFMNPETMMSDAIRTWMFEEHPFKMNKNDFLSEIIYLGKILYLNDALQPNVHDTIKIQYTKKQLDYCVQNEHNIWTYFIAQKTLYTTNHAEIIKFTGEGPFTAAFSKESAPRIGYWIGWQIVRKFMQNNPAISVQELMAIDDAQTILSKAKYKPKK